MPRIRSIKPDFFASPTISKLSHRARLTFVGLWCYVDDDGRGRDDPRLIKGVVWPQDDDVTIAEVAEDLRDMNVLGLIRRYEKNGLKCFVIHSWTEHQRISHKTKSKLPRPPAVSRKPPEASRLPLEVLRPEVEVGSGSGSGGGKGSGSGTREAAKPQEPHEVTNPELNDLTPEDREAVELLLSNGKSVAGAIEMVEQTGAAEIMAKFREAS